MVDYIVIKREFSHKYTTIFMYSMRSLYKYVHLLENCDRKLTKPYKEPPRVCVISNFCENSCLKWDAKLYFGKYHNKVKAKLFNSLGR